jgi:hypothetical protein
MHYRRIAGTVMVRRLDSMQQGQTRCSRLVRG